jgi:hypothetical protein
MMDSEKDQPQRWYQDGELVTVFDPAGRPGRFRVCVVEGLPAGRLVLYPDGAAPPTPEIIAELLADESRPSE